jgi:hypothetical protein
MSENINQSRKLIDEFIIPKASSKAFILKKGQILRVTAHEGKQVAELKFINADNHKEQFASMWSACMNSLGTTRGGYKKQKELISGVPFERTILQVIDDKVGRHYFGGSCSRRVKELKPECYQEHTKYCNQLFEECLEPYNLKIEDLEASGTFCVFMNVLIKDDQNGSLEFYPPKCEKGDYIEFQAEIDVIVAAVSCSQRSVINDYEIKAMMYQIYETN